MPELFTSGYLFSGPDEILPYAEAVPGGSTTEFLVQLAGRFNCVIVAGIPEIEGEAIYNTAVVVGPEGYIGKQRKNHLTKIEKRVFTANGKPSLHVFEAAGIKFAVLTCFDAWFPSLAADAVRGGAEVLVQPANFGGNQTPGIMRVRAMENHVFCLTANRLGSESQGGLDAKFRGESSLFSPAGRNLFNAYDSEGVFAAEVDLNEARTKSNIMCDDLAAEWARY